MFKKLFIIGIMLILILGNVNAITNTGLTHYYTFEEANGKLLDRNGTLDATNTATTYQATGKVNYGYTYVAGSNSTTVLDSTTGLNTAETSISFWYKAGTNGTSRELFYWAQAANEIRSVADASNNLNFNVYVSGEYVAQINCGALTANTWYMLTYTLKTNEFKCHINDGTPITDTSGAVNSGTAYTTATIGKNAVGTLSGTLDEMSIWNTVLTQADINDLYNSGAGTTYPFPTLAIDANFDYSIDKTDAKIILEDTSTTIGATEINQWTYLLDDTNIYYSMINGDYNYAVTEFTDYNIGLRVDTNNDLNDFQYYTINSGDWTAPTTTIINNLQIPLTVNYSLDLNCADNNVGCEYINFSIDGGDYNYYLIGDNPVNIIINGGGDHNIAYFSSDFNDNNEALNTYHFTNYGSGQFNFYDDANAGLTGMIYTVTPSINGISSGTLADVNLDLNFNGITSGTYTFNFSKSTYTTKNFSLDINEFSDFNYPFVVIATDATSSVDFQVFNESGATANNTIFTAFDYDLQKYVDIQITDSLGRVTFNLNKTKSDYNFFSDSFNFGTTVWNIHKPKDTTTLIDISGNWKYSITGASYSSGTNIVADVQKLLLQNTVSPYYIAITDVAETYTTSTFGLQSTTTEDNKNLDPYLYLYGSAELKLIKLLRYSTNIPISEPYELNLNLYTDSNGIIPIGTYINDSTGTYNIYMDTNAHYKIVIDTETFELNPSLGVYYVYLSQDIGLDYNLPMTDTNDSFSDGNFPTIFLEVREYAFGCSITETNCYESAMFSVIAMILLTIIFIALIPSTPLQQTVISAVLLSLFTAIGFMPLWLFGITLVIIIAWGIFS